MDAYEATLVYERPTEESIYNLIKINNPAPPRPARYVSKYPHDTPPTASTFGPTVASQIMGTNLAGDFAAQPRNHNYQKSGRVCTPPFSDSLLY
jgi:hypothetical protein